MPSTTMTVEEVRTELRIGRNSAYELIKRAYEDRDENYFTVHEIGQQYRVEI